MALGFATDSQAYPMPGMTLQVGSRQEQINHQIVRAYTEGISSLAFHSDVAKELRGFPWTDEETRAPRGDCTRSTRGSELGLLPPGGCSPPSQTSLSVYLLGKALQSCELSGCKVQAVTSVHFLWQVVCCLHSAAVLALEIALRSLRAVGPGRGRGSSLRKAHWPDGGCQSQNMGCRLLEA